MERLPLVGPAPDQDEWDTLVDRLRSRRGDRSMQIMQLLRVLDDLLA